MIKFLKEGIKNSAGQYFPFILTLIFFLFITFFSFVAFYFSYGNYERSYSERDHYDPR